MRRFAFVLLAGCASAPAFPSNKPLVTHDTDLDPVSVQCVKRPSDKDKGHVSCAPEPYVSPLAWDAADNSFFRPLAKIWAVDPPKEARNVNALDEVPDSSWFTNRIGKKHPSAEELARGACRPEDMLDPDSAKDGDYVIDQGKPNGASPGFRVKIGGKKKYMFKTDFAKEPERPSAAAAIGTAAYFAAGFNTSCEQVIFVDPAKFTLTPGLKATANDGITRPFDQKALERVYGEAVKIDSKYRFQASAWLSGFLIGPFKYEGMRKDDPNDIIPHEDRRDLRGARLIAAWLHHFDAREQNSMDAWVSSNKDNPEASPGWVKHYYLDTSDCLGSVWDWDGISRRMGDSYLVDWQDIGVDFITLGGIIRPWEKKQMEPGFEMFGYFSAKEFDPERWRNEYPNPAFGRATEHDNAWMARVLSRFDRADIRTLVKIGRFSRADAEDYVASVLEDRLVLILKRYLTVLSPIADVHTEGDRVCGVNLARRRELEPNAHYTYRAGALPVAVEPEGRLCVTVPPGTSHVRVESSAAKGVLDVQVSAGANGLEIAGLRRLDP